MIDRNVCVKFFVILLVILVAAVAVCLLYPSDDRENADNRVKYDIVSDGSFDLAYDASGTHTSGIYYMVVDGDQRRLTIVADITVGTNDFGGVSFNFGPGMWIQSVSTNEGYDLASPVSVWWSAESDAQAKSFVSVCRGSVTQPYGHWTGTVVIELAVQSDNSNHFLISAGSMIKDDGTVVIGPALLDVSL